jgi:hypothetical protein
MTVAPEFCGSSATEPFIEMKRGMSLLYASKGFALDILELVGTVSALRKL